MTHAIWAKEQLAKYTTSFAEVMVGQSKVITIMITSPTYNLQDIITFPQSREESDVQAIQAIIRGHNRRATSFRINAQKQLDELATTFNRS